jgi:hypothetical protein
MPARDSNASFVFLVVLITGVAVAALSGDGNEGLTSSNALYELSESWRTSVRFVAAAR